MSQIVLCANETKSRANFLANQQIPLNYMGDYSLMGFVVDHYSKALRLLLSEGYRVDIADDGALITVKSSDQLLLIQNLFSQNHIRCEYSDIADSFYQA